MSVESQFGYVASGISGTHISHIPEAEADVHILIDHLARWMGIVYHIERQRIQEVGPVGSLKHTEEGTLGS